MHTFHTALDAPFCKATSVALCIALASMLCIPALIPKNSFAEEAGTIVIELTSNTPSISDGNRMYSLSGARYCIYSDYQCTNLCAEAITDIEGKAVSGPLASGRYFIRQTSASPGYALSDHLTQIDVPAGRSVTTQTSQTPCYSMPDTLVRQVNAETGSESAVAGAKLNGAQYTISYYDATDSNTVLGTPTRTWVFETDDHGKAKLSQDYRSSGYDLFEDTQGKPVLPLGHYTLVMSKAPLGFIEDPEAQSRDFVISSTTETEALCDFEPFVQKLHVIRGDVSFRKIDENMNVLSGVPFLLSYANGDNEKNPESHLVITDENGFFTSDAARFAHSSNTNASDSAATAQSDGVISLDETLLVNGAGTWFSMDGEGLTSQPSDMRGALPYGVYKLQELPCSANEGMNLISRTFPIYKNGFTTTLNDIVDTRPSMSYASVDSSDSDKLVFPAAGQSIKTTVNYRNLVVGKSYTITCTAQLKSTGEVLAASKDAPASVSKTIVPSKKDDKLVVDIPLDASQIAGEQVVIDAILTSEDGMTVRVEDFDENEKTISIEPLIIASAYDLVDEDEYVMGSQATVAEHIAYSGLQPGVLYCASCVLNDKATGNALRDSTGNVIRAQKEFAAEESSGSVDMELPVDTSGIAGHDIVVFDELSEKDGTTIASHTDLENKDQTLKTVKLTTNAVDKADGDKIFNADSDSVCIIDTVKYANLEVGEQYRLTGILMDKETGAALSVKNKKVNGSTSFVPEEVSGSVDVEYTFDASDISSEVIVVFETLMHDDKVIAEHADIDDVAQTVTSEDIDSEKSTSAANESTGEPLSNETASGKESVPATGETRIAGMLMFLGAITCSAAWVGIAAYRRKRLYEMED